jgi:hypothetical protein
MKRPQIVILGFDDWLAKQLRSLAADERWTLHDLRQPAAVKNLLAAFDPTFLLLQVDPQADASPGLALLAELHTTRPEIPAVVVSDGKLPEEERAAWTAAVMDLGAVYVLFPPLTGPVLEDLAGGIMATLAPRASGVIDLAEEPPE